MSPDKPDPGKIGYTKIKTKESEEVLSKVLREHEIFQSQRDKRKQLLRRLSEHDKTQKVGVVAFLCSESANASIGPEDIPGLGDALSSIGDVDQLDFILDGPGGDGPVAEKIIELCRSYCKKFRVIVPNRAKSAATIIALGADQIVMGHTSELGPIDAQVMVVTSGLPRYISAQSFIDARESLESRFKEAAKKREETKHILQQIASLDPSFIDHCEKLMGFSTAVAKKNLCKYMFKSLPNAEQNKRIAAVLKALASVSEFKVHGRMINANTAKTELKLDVHLLPKDDPHWKLIWHYYIRVNVAMSGSSIGKLIETKNELLMMRAFASS
ncbi:MAG TPA: hypothetical protein VI685_29215, partial [Candidatus Angelobacter sp.]